MLLRTAILIGLSATLVSAAPKNRDWQTGTLLDIDKNSYFGRSYSHEDSGAPFFNGMTQSSFHSTSPAPSTFVFEQYVVDSGTYVYLVEVMQLKSAKPFPLLPSTTVKFAVDKKKLWLLRPDGSQLQTNIAKRKAKFQPTR